ncbi:MAG TPA: hypothetical protein VLA34_07115, partial [Candidatus Krumholzibacterium sp.]|nr:hypothetical protein [Candidatus Krumholzibacterium sp.]
MSSGNLTGIKRNSRVGIFFISIAVLTMVLVSVGCGQVDVSGTPELALRPPVAAKKPMELTAHGDTRVDEYYWLRERDDPEVIAYLEAENYYTKAVLRHTEKLQEELFREIVGRISESDETVPYLKNGYYYYERYEEGGEYPVYCRREGSLDAEEEVLLDVNEMAKGYDYFQVTGLAVSPDNSTLAFGVDIVSRRKYTICFKDIGTGEMLADSIPVTTGRAVWANDNRTVFYSVKDETLRPFKVLSHALGTEVSVDREVYREDDPTFNAYVSRSKSDEYIFINCNSTLSTEYRFLDADDPGGEFNVLLPRERDHEYEVYHHGDDFY